MNAITVTGQHAPPMQLDNPIFDASQFATMLSVAELMSKAKLVPEHLQGKPADCFLVVEQARRWEMSPFAVAQETYLVKGKLLFSGKLTAAVVNTRAGLTSPLAYRFDGEGEGLEVTVSGTISGEVEPRTYTIGLKDARAVAGSSSLWKTDPRQQLCYFGARFWARRHTPHVMLGVYGDEDAAQAPPMRDITPALNQAPPSDLVEVCSIGGEIIEVHVDYAEEWLMDQVEGVSDWKTWRTLADNNPDYATLIMGKCPSQAEPPPPEPPKKPAREPLRVFREDGSVASTVTLGSAWLESYRALLAKAGDREAVMSNNIETLRRLAKQKPDMAQTDLETAEAYIGPSAEEGA